MFTRGVPVLYYGDEQGLVGDDGDKGPARTCSRPRCSRLRDGPAGGRRPGGGDHFETTAGRSHGTISAMARLAPPPSRPCGAAARSCGPPTTSRVLFVVSRMTDAGEVLVAFNTGATPITAPGRGRCDLTGLARRPRIQRARRHGVGQLSGRGRPALGYLICVSGGWPVTVETLSKPSRRADP